MPGPAAPGRVGYGPRKPYADRHGYPSRRLRAQMRQEFPEYEAWERLTTDLRDRARAAKGKGDMAQCQALRRMAKVAMVSRDNILLSRAIKRGLW